MHLWWWTKRTWTNIENDLRVSDNLNIRRKCTVGLASSRSDDSLGDLSLNEKYCVTRQRRFHHVEKNRSRDVVGYVSDNDKRPVRKGRNVECEDISLEDSDVWLAGILRAQLLAQRLVHFHRDEVIGEPREVIGECPASRTNLDHRIAGFRVDCARDGREDTLIGQEMLPQPLEDGRVSA